ncbi:MAG: hypothetical protein KatS3mg117_1025 [Geminicoccaceae bacterium]|nr:MAG: hypothetical protein KatS3mg117_1025 [Geminicoccaceae bacterium]
MKRARHRVVGRRHGDATNLRLRSRHRWRRLPRSAPRADAKRRRSRLPTTPFRQVRQTLLEASLRSPARVRFRPWRGRTVEPSLRSERHGDLATGPPCPTSQSVGTAAVRFESRPTPSEARGRLHALGNGRGIAEKVPTCEAARPFECGPPALGGPARRKRRSPAGTRVVRSVGTCTLRDVPSSRRELRCPEARRGGRVLDRSCRTARATSGPMESAKRWTVRRRPARDRGAVALRERGAPPPQRKCGR